MNKKIKAAYFLYPSAFQNIGGGEILLLKTKEHLEKTGRVEIKLFDMWKDRLEDFDILHVFGAVKECLGLMQTARSKRVKIVLSPIFFSTLQRALHEFGSPAKKAKMAVQHMAKAAFAKFPSGRRRMMGIDDIVLPNSEAEARQIGRCFGISRHNMHVVTH